MILLSILIPSLVSRQDKLAALLCTLRMQFEEAGFAIAENGFEKYVCNTLWQSANACVEALSYTDNKQITTGAKRQQLLEAAQGQYIVFIDDDDEIYPCYIAEMLKGCATGADCLAINGIITTNGKDLVKWYISKDYENKTVQKGGKHSIRRSKIYLRHTNHITAVRREIALQAGFPDKSNAEDKDYSDKLRGLLHSEHVIEPPMYHYKFSTFNKEYK